MKIILLKDVKKQGKKGDILEVKDGYGAFLIKNKEAVMATSNSLDRLNRENALTALEENLHIKDMEVLKQQLEKMILKFPIKASTDGRVFGSISTKQIASQLKQYNIEIDKKKIKLDDPLTTLGFHNITIELHKKVIATLKVQLIKESK